MKTWCKHIHVDGAGRYWMENPEAKTETLVADRFWFDENYDDWKFCPICRAKRPKQTKKGTKK